jgi:hypothetical protein
MATRLNNRLRESLGPVPLESANLPFTHTPDAWLKSPQVHNWVPD